MPDCHGFLSDVVIKKLKSNVKEESVYSGCNSRFQAIIAGRQDRIMKQPITSLVRINSCFLLFRFLFELTQARMHCLGNGVTHSSLGPSISTKMANQGGLPQTSF